MESTPAPPGFDPDAPLTEPQNDFPLTATLKPAKADPGSRIEVTATAVYPDTVLIVILAQFSDNDSHGMEAAKFADATGRAVVIGPVPADAPEGFAKVTVSATTEDDKTAIEVLDFTVTGDTCT